MKHFLKPLLGGSLLTLFLSLWVVPTHAQILDVQQKGSYINTYDRHCKQTHTRPAN